jgi:putative oxidoreductase
MSVAASSTHTSPASRTRVARIALWTVQIVLAALFLAAGISKLTGAPAMVALFNAVGIGQWFRYVTGLIEVGAAIALLIPAFAVYGALALVPTMIGAIITQVFIVHASPVAPAILLVGVAIVLWVRRHQLPRL